VKSKNLPDVAAMMRQKAQINFILICSCWVETSKETEFSRQKLPNIFGSIAVKWSTRVYIRDLSLKIFIQEFFSSSRQWISSLQYQFSINKTPSNDWQWMTFILKGVFCWEKQLKVYYFTLIFS
jgi:hypothetical protein